MKAVLELKKERGKDSIFYRYNIDGTLVWFEQYYNGHIYFVSVRPSDEIEDVEFYVNDGSSHDIYYPEWVEINIHHERLTVDQIDGYIIGLQYAKRVAEAIMNIFDNGEHMELYESCHKKM